MERGGLEVRGNKSPKMVKPHGLLDKWKEHQAAERQQLGCSGPGRLLDL